MNEKKHSNSAVIWTAVGISAALALVISLVVSALINLPAILSGRSRVVPDLVGTYIDDAEEEIASSRFIIIPVGVESSDYDEDQIVSQDPEPGTKLKSGGIIRVILSRGRPMVDIPDVSNMELAQATNMLQSVGLFIGDVVSQTDTIAEDLVIGTKPAMGTEIEKGTKVTLYVSLGPEMVEVPKVTGKKLPAAKTMIEEAGFKLGEARYQVTTEYYQGTVMKQTPKAGDKAPKGSEVGLIVAGVLR